MNAPEAQPDFEPDDLDADSPLFQPPAAHEAGAPIQREISADDVPASSETFVPPTAAEPAAKIQRQTADNPPSDTSEESPDASMDVFEALIAAGMVETPPAPPARTASVQRRTADDAPAETSDSPSEQSVDLFDALVNAGMVKPSRSGQPPAISRRTEPAAPPDTGDTDAGDQTVVPEANSPEADLLRILHLPTSTPVVGLKRAASKPAESPQIQRQPDRTAPPPAPMAEIQRAETEATTQPATTDTDQGSEDGDINQVAQQVYRLLKERLRIERERRSRS